MIYKNAMTIVETSLHYERHPEYTETYWRVNWTNTR